MSDYLQELVDNTVFLIQQGPSKESFESLAPLAELSPNDLLPELFLQVEEASEGVDMDSLLPTELMPDVDVIRNIVNAVINQNIDLLRSTVNGNYGELVVELLSVIAALKKSS
jgi:hypothetical protein